MKIANYFFILNILPILLLAFSEPTTKGNSIYGKIIMPAKNSSIFAIGTNHKYQAEEPMSESKKQIDLDNGPNNNVVISMHPLDIQPDLPPTQNAIITQKEKTFIPMVLPITQGSTVYFQNEDEFYHSIYSKPPRKEVRIGRRAPGITVSKHISKPGLVRLGCDEHTHMSALILSLDTPYFTKADQYGNYELHDLPDGRYRLQVFHPNLELYSVTVELKGGKPLKKDVNLIRT